jgi:SAM-dependent methyltransferase
MEDEEYAEEWEVRIPSFRRVARQCTTLFPHAATLLDIGAGSGLLSLAAREAGLQAWGVEPSTFLVRRARVEHGVELLEGTYPHPSLSGMRFDIIALLDVLEHVPHPLALLRNVREALNPGGLVVLGTPNCRSLAARLLGRRWWHYRAAHVGYFDRRTLTETLHRVGLAVQARTPYPRHFSMQYLLGRMKRYAPLGPGLRGLALRFPGGRVPGSIGLNLGDSDLYIARGPRGDAL